jgi:hypothetical protein
MAEADAEHGFAFIAFEEFCQFPRSVRDPPQRKGLPCRPSVLRRVWELMPQHLKISYGGAPSCIQWA